MKTTLPLLLILLCLAAGDSAGPVGRFQVIPAQFQAGIYESYGPVRHLILKLDTATGRTWCLQELTLPLPDRLRTHQISNHTVQGWVPIGEDFNTAHSESLADHESLIQLYRKTNAPKTQK